jgi:putative transposase
VARLPRFFIKGQPQHIIQRGNNRDLLFADTSDYRFYLDCLTEAAKRHGAAIHAYCLMTNHVHLLVSPEDAASIPKTLQSIGRKYVQYFNYTYQRTGTLWEGRYKATLIDTDRYLLTCMRYIELNPVRAAMVTHPKAYRWSSYHSNALGQHDPAIIPHALYRQLDRRRPGTLTAYRALFKTRISENELTAIREATNKAWVLGSDRFKTRIEAIITRRAAPQPRGRPPRRRL